MIITGGICIMEIREFEYIIAIAEEKSISRAASRLFMAQSSLSHFLAALETSMDCQLFIRTAKGIRPTDAGEILIRHAYESIAGYHRVRDEIQDINQMKKGQILVGISTFRGSYLLPPVLRAFRMSYPDIHIIIREANSLQLEQMLQRGDLDLALLALPVNESRLEVDFLLRDEICLITSSAHPVLKAAKKALPDSASKIPYYVDVEDTIPYEYILSDSDTVLGRSAREVFRSHGLLPETYNDTLTAPFSAAMGAAGLGLAFTYYSARHTYQNAEFLSLGKDGRFLDLGIAMPRGQYHSRACLAFRNVLLDILSES